MGTTVASSPRMMSGYCFRLDTDAARLPSHSQDEDWDIEVYKPDGREVLYGSRMIDGSLCRVFRCHDGNWRAQLRVCTG